MDDPNLCDPPEPIPKVSLYIPPGLSDIHFPVPFSDEENSGQDYWNQNVGLI